MSGSTRAGGLPRGQRRVARLSLALALLLIVGCASVTGVWGPTGVRRALERSSILRPPPPAAVIAVDAGGAPVRPGAMPINPTTQVSVSVQNGTLREVRLTDVPGGQPVPGVLAPDGRSWHSAAPLRYASTYQVVASAVGVDQRLVRRTETVSTIRPAVLTTATLYPGLDSVGVGQPVVVRFNHPVADRAAAERALSVTTTPAQPGAWYWMSSTEAHYRAASYWQPGTTIQMTANLFGVDLGKGAFGARNRSETVRVHDSWIARADGASESMQIFHNGALVRTMPISLGSPDHPSHRGPHVISDKKPSIIMDSCTYGVCKGEPGYYREKVDLDLRISNDGEFVHSAPWSVGQQGSDNVSHGCVNLSPANAQWFYNHFNIGDVVEITNSGGSKLPVWDTYGDWELSWDQWLARGGA